MIHIQLLLLCISIHGKNISLDRDFCTNYLLFFCFIPTGFLLKKNVTPVITRLEIN